MNYKSFLTGLKLPSEIQRNNFIFRCYISIHVHYKRTGKCTSEFSNDSLVSNNELKYIIWVLYGVIANKSFFRLLYTVSIVYIVKGTTYYFALVLFWFTCQGLKLWPKVLIVSLMVFDKCVLQVATILRTASII